MTTATSEITIDAAAVARISAAFHRCLATHEADDGLFAEDAFFDILPPLWRFQVQGPETFLRQLRSVAAGPVSIEVVRTVPTATGFVSETVETVHGERPEVARHLWLCEVREGRISEVLTYCNGGWDEELRARHAAEAPMLRP